jgi:hypothetical protein
MVAVFFRQSQGANGGNDKYAEKNEERNNRNDTGPIFEYDSAEHGGF